MQILRFLKLRETTSLSFKVNLFFVNEDSH